MKKVHIIWAIIVVVALAGGYFWGKAGAGSAQAALSGNGGGSAGGGRRFGGGSTNGQAFAAGKIVSMDATGITLQLPNGNSEVVFYSSSTDVTKPTAVPLSVLSVGNSVVIDGIQNSDGSMTASSIQVRPAAPSGALGG